MKKLLGFIFLISLSISSCSSDNDNSTNNNSSINPPDWIIGTWLLENSSVDSGFKFTDNDICLINITTQACNKETLELYENTEIYTNVDEVISNDFYSIEITISSSVNSYEFEKVSDTEIIWMNSGITGANPIYVKE